jgi:hypothetical protein
VANNVDLQGPTTKQSYSPGLMMAKKLSLSSDIRSAPRLRSGSLRCMPGRKALTLPPRHEQFVREEDTPPWVHWYTMSN